jgi:phosphomevalonate kinase
MITVRAPGKLFVAGEYAVVEPGEPSVLVAVDRYLIVRLTESEGTGSVHSSEYGRMPLTWWHGDEGLSIGRDHGSYEYVLAALTVIERLRAELGIPPRLSDLRIESQLDDASGRKFGLGSSAAVTVATIRALDEFYGLGLSRRKTFQLALLATITIAPTASGGDLAASTFGGWIEYRAPDRAALLRRMAELEILPLLDDDAWSALRIARLNPPAGLRLLVGWTGEPASTARLVDEVQRRKQSPELDYERFLRDSRACVGRLVGALEGGDEPAALEAIRQARRLLRGLGGHAGLGIETERLATLCDTAEAAGAAAKPSGAGGGDCGIVLAPEDLELGAMLREWETHDIRHLTVSVHEGEGAVDD